MKEIDLLPEWYKSNRRRQISYQAQYVALGCIFALIVAWSFIAAGLISKDTAELQRMASQQAEAESVRAELAGVKTRIASIKEKTRILGEISSEINVANILAELSFLIDERIVLSRMNFIAERFPDTEEDGAGSGSVRAARVRNAKRNAAPLGDVRFKVVIGGVASGPRDVAELVCEWEDSPYFCQVYPSYSRNKKINAKSSFISRNHQVSEFEISCYLANYQEN